MKMFLNGEWTDASDGSVRNCIAPATGAIIDSVPCATRDDAERCLAAAKAGAAAWAERPLRSRADILWRCADAIAGNKENLCRLLCLETGKLYGQCMYELDSVIRLFRDYIEYAKHMTGKSYQDTDAPNRLGSFAFTVREPLGVAVCIVPFNYPLEMLTFKMVPALLMGNGVIVKPPADASLVVLRYGELLVKAGLPADALQIITGKGSDLGDWLIDTDKINAVSFTGSTEVGIHIAKISAPYLHHLVLELGGNDAVIVFEDADIDYLIGESLVRLWNAGQTCCGTKRYLVHNAVREQFVSKLSAILKNVKVGDPFDPATEMGSLISEQAAIHAEHQIRQAVEQGATLVCGGKRDGAFLTPALLDNVTANMDVATDEEFFSPVYSVIGFETEEEAVGIANASRYGLNAGVVTGDMNRALRVATKLQAGTVVTNSVSQWRTNEAPFGGYKMSGRGKECLEYSLKEMSQMKTIVIKGVH